VDSREVTFFDGRNAWEAQIGRFKDAVVPDISTSNDFVRELDSGQYDHLKDKPVVTYCTGGIRCEILSAMMIKEGFARSTSLRVESFAMEKPLVMTDYGRVRSQCLMHAKR